MADPAAFAKMVPGFDFLQGLVKNAGSALPNIGQWVAPTLNPEELEKRIEELRTVQFWLEQNARMLGATIQALEVQRMTLSTLKTMNVSVSELGSAMQMPSAAPKGSAASAKAARADEAAATAIGVVDPMHWWGALTQQFTQLALQAMNDGTNDTAKQFAGVRAKPSNDAAGQAQKKEPATSAKPSPRRRAAKPGAR